MKGAWYEGTSNPLDQAVDVGVANNFADWFPGGEPSPEAILQRCEELDEADGCVSGTHLDEYRRLHTTIHS